MVASTSTFALGASTRAVHLGNKPCEVTGAVVQPLILASTFRQPEPNVPLPAGYIYSRDGNPNRDSLETVLASLEHGASAYATASGTAATNLIIQALGTNHHCLAIRGVYCGTEEALLDIAKPLHGWSTTFFPFETATDDEIYAAIQPDTKVIWAELPTNPLLAVADIANIARIAKTHPSRPLVVVDNTFGSPYFNNPLVQGADIVMESTTKYIGGHSDVVGGVVVLREGLEELGKRMKWLQMAAGANPSPFDCFLLTRSIKTLSLRCLQHGLSALTIAAHLEKHPLVEEVLYPGLISHPHHERVKRALTPQARKDLESRNGWESLGLPFGGVFSFRVKGPDEAGAKFIAACKLFTLAESLGGAESLVKNPWLMSTSPLSDAERRQSGLTPSLIRMSVGLEDVEDLIADIEQALETACAGGRST